MKRLLIVMVLCSFVLIPATLLAYPTVYPTSTTIYNPKKCWNGYTIYGYGSDPKEPPAVARLIDMNGKVVHKWKGIDGFPYKLLPGGYLMGQLGYHSKTNALVQVDWDGKPVWKFDKAIQIKVDEKMVWSAEVHHDFQREGNPVGYYVPGMKPLVDKGSTLILSAKRVKNPKITCKNLNSSWIIEVTWDGKIIWDWLLADHFDELGLSEEAKNAIYRSAGGMGMNSMAILGPNKWYDAGDERFHPDNIICQAHRLNILMIISKKTGKIVWKVGPDYNASPAFRKLGWIIGPHHIHMIPKGLPGGGHILIFDNGGESGYGAPNPMSPTGANNTVRYYSRVLEFNPQTLDIVWEYSGLALGYSKQHSQPWVFFSPFISSAQRLPNGNTMICEGDPGRLLEVTPKLETVWEYVNPFKDYRWRPQYNFVNSSYRAFRVPYGWIPQLKKPVERAVIPPENVEFRIEPVGSQREEKESDFRGY